MTSTAQTPQMVTIRPAVEADTDAIATIWHLGWRDGHLGHVPIALIRHRHPGDFRARVPARLDSTTVATLDAGIVGFVMVQEDEIEQIYVAAGARGTGVAPTLLRHGETVIAARFDRAWLAVVAGNTRARRFYERNGWADSGPLHYPARTAGDTTVSVPARRYEKSLTTQPEEGGRDRSR